MEKLKVDFHCRVILHTSMGVNFIFNFTGFDWLKERGYRPSCHQNCRPAEKAEVTTDPPPGSATPVAV